LLLVRACFQGLIALRVSGFFTCSTNLTDYSGKSKKYFEARNPRRAATMQKGERPALP
jgi:hypothetical protein